MKRSLLIATIPLLLLGTVWQTSRYALLSAEVEAMEGDQEVWIDQNKKLVASIAVVSRREQIAAWAARLGLKKASPARRLLILPSQLSKPGSGGGSDG